MNWVYWDHGMRWDQCFWWNYRVETWKIWTKNTFWLFTQTVAFMGGSSTWDWLWYAAKIPAAYSTVTTWDTVWIWELQSSATRSTKAIPVVITGQCLNLGFIVWGRRPEWPKATTLKAGSGGMPPRKFFEMNMRWDAIWCILKHKFEKCYRVCTDLVASGWFFRYSYLCTVMITIFLGWKLGILGGGGKLLPLKYPR